MKIGKIGNTGILHRVIRSTVITSIHTCLLTLVIAAPTLAEYMPPNDLPKPPKGESTYGSSR